MKKQTKNTTPTTAHRQIMGVVLTAKEQKTLHVRVETIKTDAKYRKQFTTSKKYAVHDEKGMAKVGDTILFEECRPLSKTKRWRVVKVLTKGQA